MKSGEALKEGKGLKPAVMVRLLRIGMSVGTMISDGGVEGMSEEGRTKGSS